MERTPVQDTSVLVIDDDPDVLSMLSLYLDNAGYQVCAKPSGEAGLVALDKRPFEIVVTDLKMPLMNGLEVLRRVKEKRPETEVLVLTGYATIQDGVEAMREGAYDFLLKPVRTTQIDTALARCVQWIRHKRSHAELQEVNRKLLELGRMKERFLAVTDHELRTPVTVLDGMLHFLLRQHPDLPDPVRTRLESLRQVSNRLVGLVRDIHDIVQSRSHRFPVAVDWTTAERLLSAIRLDFEMARFSRTLDLELDSQVPDDLRILADGNRLGQAVSELIHNAVKATPDGGRVGVRVFRREAEAGPRFCVSVWDTGVGIPEKDRDRILDAFASLGDDLHHHSSEYDFGGSGLGIGLTIVMEIAKAHSGGLDFASTPGEGSTFTLWIPAG